MSLKFSSASASEPLRDVIVFLGGSIPDPRRWEGHFDAREITDAMVAAARAVLGAGGIIVTGAHPTISPLLLYVAAELPRGPYHPRVLIYQSALFEPVMPKETRRFQEEGIGSLYFTEALPGDRPDDPDHWDGSLRIMRQRMFADTNPRAAIFIGGMDSVLTELELLREQNPTVLTYPVVRPGGKAASLIQFAPASIRPMLAESDVYPALFRKVIEDLAFRIGG